jgi:Flp pilus assembly protein TadD
MRRFDLRWLSMIPTRRRLEYASGYLGLGMLPEAAEELDQIAADEKQSPEVLRMWVALYHETKQWQRLAAVAQTWATADPKEEQGWISWAYGLRELERVEEAQTVLLKAEPLHGKSSAVLHYNLACYACLLGEKTIARQRLARAISMDAAFSTRATEDPDLAALKLG